MELIHVPVKVRRFDLSDSPDFEADELELESGIEYSMLKKRMREYFGIAEDEAKVIKIRNKDYVLVPMMNLLNEDDTQSPFIIDITATSLANESNLLQDAYVDAVRQKFRNMESRISQAEVLLPQLQWRRQSHLDGTVSSLSSKVSFLNRRIDELMPSKWKSKMPATIS
ncbi:PREDICTED: uncharacterized protein LOC108557096 [Nicrophorus vespilloides]|uniref:Uncharacterized protein LOC108557096 n=1 Tax=Nicrophorus vespilloides TaxID=110193 RepID=A0ABM1M321_NICVS|nr:PREDICTED: uncharacterized protein LOC108557096 [Nicrophorus vespilloides]